MFKLFTAFLTGCGLILSLTVFGQAPYDTPLGAMPMQYNPSFAGQASSPRMSANFKYGLEKDRVLYLGQAQRLNSYLSYDQFISAIRTGVGITTGYYNHTFTLAKNVYRYYYDKASNSTSWVTVSVAPKISLKGKYTISPSIDFSYAMGNIKTTLNQIPVEDTLWRDPQGKLYGINSRAGVLFNTNKFYIGYTVNVLRRSLAGTGSNYNPANYHARGVLESYLQAGYTFQRSSQSNFSFTPQVVIQLSKYNSQTRMHYTLEAFNLNFRYKQFIWGINDNGNHMFSFRDNKFKLSPLLNMGGIHLGWQTDKVRVMLTNSYSRERYLSSGYTGQISLRYILGSKNQSPDRGW